MSKLPQNIEVSQGYPIDKVSGLIAGRTPAKLSPLQLKSAINKQIDKIKFKIALFILFTQLTDKI